MLLHPLLVGCVGRLCFPRATIPDYHVLLYLSCQRSANCHGNLNFYFCSITEWAEAILTVSILCITDHVPATIQQQHKILPPLYFKYE